MQEQQTRNMSIKIRPIEKRDDPVLADLIRSVFREFKIDKPGTVYTDPTTDHLSGLFEASKSVYWVAEEDGILLGGCGIYPTDGLPPGCAEVVKFYLSSESRGKGIGKKLMLQCFKTAADLGYRQLYLESFPELGNAVKMYERAGFSHITAPLGNSGHHACTIWMVKDL
jgi:putative acetyltransferase